MKAGTPDYDTCTKNEQTAPVTTEMEEDTLTTLPADVFGIRDWKLIECGSNFTTKCGLLSWDMFPAEPIQALCDTLARSADHNCEWDPMADTSHLTCPVQPDGIDRCLAWFDSL